MLWPKRVAIVGLSMLLLAEVGATLAGPQIVKRFVDELAAPGDRLVQLAVVFLAIILVRELLRIGRTAASEHLAWSTTNTLRADLTRHVLDLDLSFHHENASGDLFERIDGDASRLKRVFSQLVPEILSAGALAIGTLVAVGLEDWRLSVALSVLLAGVLVVHRWDQQWAVPFWRREREAATELTAFVEERADGAADIRAAGAVHPTMQRLHDLLGRHALRAVRAEVATDAGWAATNVVYGVGFLVGMGVGALLFARGAVSLGAVFLVVHYLQTLHRPVTRIGGQVEELVRARICLDRAKELFQICSGLESGDVAVPRSGAAPEIRLEHVWFGYKPTQPVLRDVSFTVAPMRKLGLVGRTGSGKSTIARLLFRFYDPDSGSILFDGVDARSLPLTALRSRVAFVTQDVELFAATVRENVTLFRDGVSDTAVVNALEALGLGEWLQGLPDGLDTRVAPTGGTLSSGQAQLIAFARAFLKDPGMVILDEATARVDPYTERLLAAATERLLEGRTALIISHRLKTLESVDLVVVLAEGSVAEIGGYSELAADSGSRFSSLIRIGRGRDEE